MVSLLEQGRFVEGVHYIQDSGERVCMLVMRDDAGRWKAQFSGRTFSIAAHCERLQEGKRQVGAWFRRAFPRHICNAKCRAQNFSEVKNTDPRGI